MSLTFWLCRTLLKNRPFAQYRVAHAYQAGAGVGKDEQQAVHWYQKAAEQGHAEAQYQLALMLDQGEGVARNAQEARRWYQAAAHQGHKLAALCVDADQPATPSTSSGTEDQFLQRLQQAEQGDAEAQYVAALMYQQGRGVEKDLSQMRYWLEQAAEQGHTKAQYQLGLVSHGDKDYAAALKWLSTAAGQDHGRAQFNLAMLYFRGEGTDRDLVTAYIWFAQAAENDVEQAARGRDVCWQKMDEDQRIEAQRMTGDTV